MTSRKTLYNVDQPEQGDATPEKSKGRKSWDLLGFVRHHWRGNVLTHVVQLISYAAGAGDVQRRVVVVILLHCKAQESC